MYVIILVLGINEKRKEIKYDVLWKRRGGLKVALMAFRVQLKHWWHPLKVDAVLTWLMRVVT